MINASTLKVPTAPKLAAENPAQVRVIDKAAKLTLSNGEIVRKYIYDDILDKVNKRAPLLVTGVAYTLKQICGSTFWRPYRDEGYSSAGMCMHELVKQQRVPFIVAETLHEYPKKYHRI